MEHTPLYKYTFFYDESYHDRKITEKNGEINIHQSNSSDIYVGSFVGAKDDYINLYLDKYECFETEYKKTYGLHESQEFKSTTIAAKNFAHGIASFNKNAFQFYRDYFSLFDDAILIQLCMLSKTAYVVKQIFDKLKFKNTNVNKAALIYSVTKALHNYRNNDLLTDIIDAKSCGTAYNLLIRIQDYLIDIIKKLKLNPSNLKKLELNSMQQIICALDNSLPPSNGFDMECNWDYKEIFIGFNLFLKDACIPKENIHLWIDEDMRTLDAAISIGKYQKSECGNSQNIIGLRSADILSNFIGRMIHALSNELLQSNGNKNIDLDNVNYQTKRLLNEQWFKVSKDKFDLYKKISSIFVSRMRMYGFTTYGSVYFDYSTLLFNLFQYIGGYNTYEEYSENMVMHSEYFNIYNCRVLEQRFREDFNSEPARTP